MLAKPPLQFPCTLAFAATGVSSFNPATYSPRFRTAATALVAVFALAAIVARPITVLAGPILYIDDSAGRLGTVDVQTGSVEVIGAMPAPMTDIAFAPNGTLFGVDFSSNLWEINPSTAVATDVGPDGISLNSLVFSKQGTLYAASEQTQSLYSLSTATGAATLLGNVGFASAGDLAFDQGQLYLSSDTNQLIRIDSSTFAGTAVGSLGFGDVFGMATGDNGVLYGVSSTTIFSIDPASGHGTTILNYAGHGLGPANGTSFITEAAPEPDSIVLAILAFAAMLAVSIFRRRRSRLIAA